MASAYNWDAKPCQGDAGIDHPVILGPGGCRNTNIPVKQVHKRRFWVEKMLTTTKDAGSAYIRRYARANEAFASLFVVVRRWCESNNIAVGIKIGARSSIRKGT